MSSGNQYKSKKYVDIVILIGDCRVGKSSYLHSLVNKEGKGNHNHPPTIGVEYAPTSVKVRG